ncbi:Mbov_0399 family ICE element protein [Metamycoplasma hominis]
MKKIKKTLLIAGGIFSIASASLFSLSFSRNEHYSSYKYEEIDKDQYSFLNNKNLLKSFFTNLTYWKNSRQDSFIFNPKCYSGNPLYSDQRFIANKDDNLTFLKELSINDINKINNQPFGDYKITLQNDARKDEKTVEDQTEQIPNWLDGYRKYVSRLTEGWWREGDPDPSNPGYNFDPDWEPGEIIQTIKKSNYSINWANAQSFKKFTNDYDIKIKTFNNRLSDPKISSVDIAYFDNAYIAYTKFKLSYNDHLEINYDLTKWHGIDLEDAYSLICFLANYNNFKHSQKFMSAFHLQNSSQEIIIDSDTMGKLTTGIDLNIFKGGKSNLEKLQEIAEQMDNETSVGNFIIKYGYEVKPISDGNHFNLIFKIKQLKYKGKDITNSFASKIFNEADTYNFANNFAKNQQSKIQIKNLYNMFYSLFKGKTIMANVPVRFTPSQIYQTYADKTGFVSRLWFKYGVVLNQNNLSNIQENHSFNFKDNLQEDKPIQLEPANGNYGGKWLVHTPLQVNFDTTLEENEVLFINGQKVDVLNRHFVYHLKDLRRSASDEEKIALEKNDSNKPQEELNDHNSRKKNEYIVEIKKFKPGTNNSGEPIATYKIKFVIVEQPINQSFKWFAWDPENNPKQKELITKELTKDGRILVDKEGNPLPNPKYDPTIDPKTGTKNQLIWIKNGTLAKEITKNLKFWYPDIKMLNDFGIFAEGAVLGKGALRNLILDKNIAKKSNVTYYKCKLYDKGSNKWLSPSEIKPKPLSSSNGNSENAYMSEEGIWIVYAATSTSISNIKLVLIDESNSPKNLFWQELENKKDNYGIDLMKKFEPFWQSTLGIYFKKWLIESKHYDKEQLDKLTYDELLPLYNECVNSSWKFADNDNSSIENAINIFNDFKWSKLQNFNGLTDKQAIKDKVLEYIRTNMSSNALTKNLIENKDWFISEFSNITEENKFLEELANVSIYGTEQNQNYEGVKLTLIGKGLYANSRKEIYFRNEAWHVYNPPIDLSTLDIQNEFILNISKKTFEEKNIPEDVVDERYRKAIEKEVINFITNQLLQYQLKTKSSGKEIEMLLNKDVEIANLNEVIAHLMRGKALSSFVGLKLVSKNANLHNYKIINFKNLGEGGKFNLRNLSYILMDNKNVIQETKPSQIRKKVIEIVVNAASKLGLEINNDYQIFAINNDAYWLELVSKYDDPKLKQNKEFYEKLQQALKALQLRKTFKYEGKDKEIEFEPKDLDLKNQLEQYKNSIIEELEREIYNNSLNLEVLYKKILLLPTNKTIGFGYGYIINKANKEYNPAIDPDWKPNPNPDDEDKAVNIFNDFKWSKLQNFNGLTDKQALKDKVLEYIRTNMSSNTLTKNLIENKDWFISEFSNITEENKFLEELANVSIYGTEQNQNYEGVKLTLIGKGLYANSRKEIYFRNEAWHVYNPPIDLSTLDIQSEFILNISKKTFEEKNIPEDVADERYRKAIEKEVINFITNQLLQYQLKTKSSGKEIEMLLNKDVEIANLNEVIAHLMRGKALSSFVGLKLVSKNANLHNYKIINFKNLGEGGKFNLRNLSYILMDNKNVIQETKPSQIRKKVIEIVVNAASKLGLEINNDYQIFAINNDAYWLELVSKYDDPKLKQNKEFYEKLQQALKALQLRKTFKYEGKDKEIEFEPKDLDLKNQLEQYKNSIIEELEREIYNNSLNLEVLYKKILLLPTNKTTGFGYGYIINKANKEYNPAIDPDWKPNPNPDDEDIVSPEDIPKDPNRIKKVVKTWWFPLVVIIGILIFLVASIFIIKSLLRKYGWSFGKRAKRIRRQNENKQTCQEKRSNKRQEKLAKKEAKNLKRQTKKQEKASLKKEKKDKKTKNNPKINNEQNSIN